jgi:hypothetical protein
VLPLVASAQTPVDPQSLVGEWTGSWISAWVGGSTGAYQLTIARVEGNTVYGRFEFTTRNVRGRREGDFVGTVEGNRLTWGAEQKSELTIDGARMFGTVGLSGHIIVTITKK